MNQEHRADPRGTYDTDEVTLTADGEPITKGEGATGSFLEIGRDGTHPVATRGSDGQGTVSTVHDRSRTMAIVLLRSSAGNAVLWGIQTGRDARLRVERRQDGAVLLEADVLMVDDGSPRVLGRGELRWDLTVVG